MTLSNTSIIHNCVLMTIIHEKYTMKDKIYRSKRKQAIRGCDDLGWVAYLTQTVHTHFYWNVANKHLETNGNAFETVSKLV